MHNLRQFNGSHKNKVTSRLHLTFNSAHCTPHPSVTPYEPQSTENKISYENGISQVADMMFHSFSVLSPHIRFQVLAINIKKSIVQSKQSNVFRVALLVML